MGLSCRVRGGEHRGEIFMCSKEEQREFLKNQIKYDFGNVFYTYVAHHICADRLEKLARWLNLALIALIAVTSTGILGILPVFSTSYLNKASRHKA